MNPSCIAPVSTVRLVSNVVLACVASSLSIEAAVISFDITDNSGGDSYSPGAAVFGSAGSIWNERIRFNSATGLALVDELGAATSVTVTYVRNLGVGIGGVTGTYASLGISNVETGAVTLGGLTAGLGYDLVVYSSVAGSPSWSVGATTKSLTQSLDWSTLSEGQHFVRFQTTADGSGTVVFTPGTSSGWSGFQIQPTAVPEPVTTTLMSAATILGFGIFRRFRGVRR